MKILFLSAIVATALVYQASAQVAVGPGSVKVSKIIPATVKTPDYSITGGPQKRSRPGDWLEVEVEFEVKVPEVDELTFDYTIMVEGKLLSGSVTHINIPQGRDRYSVVYVSPRSLERLSGGKAFTLASLQNVWVELKRQGAPIDVAALKNVQIPPLPRLTGMVLNKAETPFAPLFYDRYEAIKPSR